MPETGSDRTSNEAPEIVGGEVIAVDEARVRVRLDSGSFGSVPRSDGLPESALSVGFHGVFEVIERGPDGSTTLALRPAPIPVVGDAPFDRDVVRLHNALANHHPKPMTQTVEHVSIGEEQIQSWLEKVEASISHVRKNRAKRLNEEFYNGS